jgi:hypothetical protein
MNIKELNENIWLKIQTNKINCPISAYRIFKALTLEDLFKQIEKNIEPYKFLSDIQKTTINDTVVYFIECGIPEINVEEL